jgi:MFS family permease
VDRWPKKLILVSTNLLRAVLVALIPWSANATGGWAIYLGAFLISAATQFFVPAEAATIPSLVPKENLLTANSLFTTTMMVSVILGFALGDPLINLFSLQYVHWAITALFLLSSLALMMIHMPAKLASTRQKDAESLKASMKRFMAEIMEGFQFIRENPLVCRAMLKLALLFSIMIALCILFISFAKSYLFEDPMVASQKFAYIIMCNGIGMAMGAFWIGHAFHHARRGLMVFSGFAGVGFCLLLLSLIEIISKHDHAFNLPSLVGQSVYWGEIHFTLRMVYTYAVAIVMGIGAAFIAIPLQALLQELIPEDKRGKVFGVQFTLLSTASTLPVLLAGLAVEVVSVKTIFILIGVPLLLLGSTGFLNRLKERNTDAAATNW